MDRSAYVSAVTKRVVKRDLDSLESIAQINTRGSITAATARRYATFVGAQYTQWCAPGLLHTACFGNTIRLLSSPQLPLKPMGLVHESSRWHLIKPVAVNQPIDITSVVSALRVDDAGVARVDVTSTLSADGEAHLVETSRYVAKKSGLAPVDLSRDDIDFADADVPEPTNLRDTHGVNGRGVLDTGQLAALATRSFKADAGRAWAKVSGDINPIHISSITAKAFGYKRAILHGGAVEAWVHHHAGIDGTQPTSGATYYRAPLVLPATIELVTFEGGEFAVLDKRTGRDLIHVQVRAHSRGGAKQIHQATAPAAHSQIGLPRVDGRVSSTVLVTGMLGAAVEGDGEALATIERVAKNWRKDYRDAFVALTRNDNPARGSEAAYRGLAYARANVTNGDGVPLADVSPVRPSSMEGDVIHGSAEPIAALAVPYRGETLAGPALESKLADWTKQGVMTPRAATKISALTDEDLDLTGLKVGILGVGAELAPLRFFLERGADVYGVIRPDSRKQGTAAITASSLAGTLTLSPTDASDVVKDPGAVAAWLIENEVDVVVDALYAPGDKFLLAALGADTVMELVARDRDVFLAWFGSPSDAYVLDGVVDKARERPSFVRFLKREQSAFQDGVFNGLIDLQGPNYAAAKRIGRWRATTQWAEGKGFSYNVAPMAKTASVLSSSTLRAAYAGLDMMGMETFDVDTASHVMGALLVSDLRAYQRGEQRAPTFLVDSGVPTGMWKQTAEPQSLMKKAVLLGSGQFLRGGRGRG